MPLNVSFIGDEGRLVLTFQGKVDISLSQDICDLCRKLHPDVRVCVMDLCDVERFFDSGVALLQLLHHSLVETGTTVVILGNGAELRDRITGITSRPRYPVPARYHIGRHLPPYVAPRPPEYQVSGQATPSILFP
jgi:anti-anti-sigma regulatory factor